MFALDVFTCCSSKTEQSSVDVNRHITPEVVTTPEPEVDANRQITPEVLDANLLML